MQYKTMVLGLLEQRPRMHRTLRKTRQLLPIMEQLALLLKTRHYAWKEKLSRARPGSDETQTASEALEMALAELEAALPNESPQDEAAPLSLDAAMQFIRRPTPPLS